MHKVRARLGLPSPGCRHPGPGLPSFRWQAPGTRAFLTAPSGQHSMLLLLQILLNHCCDFLIVYWFQFVLYFLGEVMSFYTCLFADICFLMLRGPVLGRRADPSLMAVNYFTVDRYFSCLGLKHSKIQLCILVASGFINAPERLDEVHQGLLPWHQN